jgi:hypothetical protein
VFWKLKGSNPTFSGSDRNNRDFTTTHRESGPEAVRPGGLHRLPPHEGPLDRAVSPSERRKSGQRQFRGQVVAEH